MTLDYRILSDSENTKAFPKRGQMDLAVYEDMLRGLEDGVGVELVLIGVTPRAMKRRIGTAAKKLGKSVKWKTGENAGLLLFKVGPIVKRAARKQSDGRLRSNRA